MYLRGGAALFFSLFLAACQGDRAQNRAAADQVLAAVEAWLGPIEMERELEDLVDELERSGLTPSRVFEKTLGWTDSSPTKKTLSLEGRAGDEVYRILAAPTPRPPTRPGDYRGTFRIEKLAEHEYRWSGEDDVLLGEFPLSVLAVVIESVLEELSSSQGPSELLRLLPETKNAWGRLGTLDGLERRQLDDGTTAVTLRVSLHPDRIEEAFPDYARYLDKAVRPIEMELDVLDEEDTPWCRVELEDLGIEAHLRISHQGLVPLHGPPRQLPERLVTVTSLSTKAGWFRVGFRNLRSRLRFQRRPDEIEIAFLYLDEPEWRIPFLVEPFLTSALRYPFEGDGVEITTRFHRRADGGTLMASEFRMAVKETWLLRRVGGGFGREYDDSAEKQRRQFAAEVIGALKRDIRAVLSGESASAPREGDDRRDVPSFDGRENMVRSPFGF
ncbi:MAG TPA: hypothetical protein VLK65_32340 [Vicinamibacteria bacterium]|nr:hypothetical protein [Vicinamibacteria bacterium]